MGHLSAVLPDVRDVTADTTTRADNSQGTQISLWHKDVPKLRSDLAITLEASGTGVAQILAILAGLVEARDEYRVFLIDEPQVHLHPSAVRRLIFLLKQFSQHQFVIATHSTLVVSAAKAEQVLQVTRESPESVVRVFSGDGIETKRAILADLGSSFEDVFGADKILWCEGPTEENCFALLVKADNLDPSGNAVIRPVVHTDKVLGRQADEIVRIYRTLSEGDPIIPRTVGFLFDREVRRPQDRKELEKMPEGASVSRVEECTRTICWTPI